MYIQAKVHKDILGAKAALSEDKATALSGIEKFLGELMRLDKKLTILKTLQVH